MKRVKSLSRTLPSSFKSTKNEISQQFEPRNKELIFAENPNEYTYESRISIWEPPNLELEKTTLWSFPERGDWATHSGEYPGNWSPYIPRNVILRYTREGEVVLDQFVGSGTTLIEAKLLNRKGIGFDINENAVKIAQQKIRDCIEGRGQVEINLGNAKDLKMIEDESIDLICTHPPYANIIKYSDNIKGDISLSTDVNNYLEQMNDVAGECFRVLKRGKICAILMGDTRKNGCIIPLGFKVMEQFLNNGFILKEIIIKEQHNCKSTGYWIKHSMRYNFLLIAHEYLFIFKKP